MVTKLGQQLLMLRSKEQLELMLTWTQVIR